VGNGRSNQRLAVKKAADARARALASTVRKLRKAGFVSVSAITRELNKRQVPTARGCKWHRKSVSQLLQRLQKLEHGELDALIFVGGAPVPAFEQLDKSFHFVQLPANPILEQIYQRKKIDKTIYSWAGEVETFAVPSVIMTRDRKDSEYVTLIQRLLLAILSNKEKLDAIGHPKWKTSQFRFMVPDVVYRPSNDLLLIYNILDAYGYRITKK
jgi:hypothetical protein